MRVLSAMILVCGFGAASAIVLLAMYPIFSLDIFYYMNADRIWSVYRENPSVPGSSDCSYRRYDRIYSGPGYSPH